MPPPPLEFRISINWNISTGNGRNRKTGVSLTIRKTRDRACKGLARHACNLSKSQERAGPSFNRRSVAFFEACARAHGEENRAYATIDRWSVWSRVTRLARTSSKYKYVIRRNEGACVTEHLPRTRGPRPCPKEHRLKRRVLWDKEKVWRTGSCRSRWRRAPFCLAGAPIT